MEGLNFKKAHEESPRHEENVIRQIIENLGKSLESQERRLEITESKPQKTAIEAQIRNLENQLADKKRELERVERDEDGAGHA